MLATEHEHALNRQLGEIKINVLIKMNSTLTMGLLDQSLAAYGISASSYFAMMMIYGSAKNLANPSALSDATGETRGNMTRICDDLVRQGYIRRVASLEDRRRVDLSLTEEGTALLQAVVPILRKSTESVFSCFNAAEKTTLVNLLSRLLQSLESET